MATDNEFGKIVLSLACLGEVVGTSGVKIKLDTEIVILLVYIDLLYYNDKASISIAHQCIYLHANFIH